MEGEGKGGLGDSRGGRREWDGKGGEDRVGVGYSFANLFVNNAQKFEK